MRQLSHIKIKDQNGNIVNGTFRSTLGDIVVKDDDSYEAYKKELSNKERMNQQITTLEQQVLELSKLVHDLISNKHSM